MSRAARTVPKRQSPTTPAATGIAQNAKAGAKQWLAEREARVLPVPYFHVVFTLPAAIADIAYQNKAVIYDLLFKASAETLTTIAADPKHLGARIGITSVLHTWGSALTHHPHVHMIVPGGGIAPDGKRWVPCRPGFFLPVRVLSRLFRRLFLDKLTTAHQQPSSSAITLRSPMHRPLPQIWRRCAKSNGSSIQSARSADPGRAGLSLPIYPPRRHLQQPPGRIRRQRRHLQVEGLSDRRPRPIQN